jgi:hypothetical protein
MPTSGSAGARVRARRLLRDPRRRRWHAAGAARQPDWGGFAPGAAGGTFLSSRGGQKATQHSPADDIVYDVVSVQYHALKAAQAYDLRARRRRPRRRPGVLPGVRAARRRPREEVPRAAGTARRRRWPQPFVLSRRPVTTLAAGSRAAGKAAPASADVCPPALRVLSSSRGSSPSDSWAGWHSQFAGSMLPVNPDAEPPAGSGLERCLQRCGRRLTASDRSAALSGTSTGSRAPSSWCCCTEDRAALRHGLGFANVSRASTRRTAWLCAG